MTEHTTTTEIVKIGDTYFSLPEINQLTLTALQYSVDLAVKKHVDNERREWRIEVRKQIADYMRSEGCSCCENMEKHEDAKEKIAKLLGVPKYDDGSGYDFGRFESEKDL